MAPKQKSGQKPKPNAAEEVEETFQAVVGLAVGKCLRDFSMCYIFTNLCFA